MSLSAFEQFAQTVFDDPALLEQLRRTDTLADLMATVISEARARGLDITEEDLTTVAAFNRRAWLERWVYQ
jgi:CMP-2-keto-3-deoxyoctulosonic acid synthetase